MTDVVQKEISFPIIPEKADQEMRDYLLRIEEIIREVSLGESHFTSVALQEFSPDGAGFKDEDDMASDSATSASSEQSVKAYADQAEADAKSYADGIITAFSLVNFTRDMTAGSGTQEVTGAGFTPRLVMLFGSINANDVASWGFDNGSSKMCTFHQYTGNLFTYTDRSVNIQPGGGPDWQYGNISSMDADGFTFSWTKAGSPTGTATMIALCFK